MPLFTFDHSYACVSSLFFAKINVFMKLITFFSSNIKCFWKTKTLDSSRIFKMKVILPWTIFKILIPTAVFYKERLLHEKTLCNIFKTINAAIMTRAVFWRCNIVRVRKGNLKFQVSSCSQNYTKMTIFFKNAFYLVRFFQLHKYQVNFIFNTRIIPTRQQISWKICLHKHLVYNKQPVKSSTLKRYVFLRLGLGMWLMKYLSKKLF